MLCEHLIVLVMLHAQWHSMVSCVFTAVLVTVNKQPVQLQLCDTAGQVSVYLFLHLPVLTSYTYLIHLFCLLFYCFCYVLCRPESCRIGPIHFSV